MKRYKSKFEKVKKYNEASMDTVYYLRSIYKEDFIDNVLNTAQSDLSIAISKFWDTLKKNKVHSKDIKKFNSVLRDELLNVLKFKLGR